MIYIALPIFLFCLWAVFSKHFCDGIVTKHCLTFSAITAMLVMVDRDNKDAFLTSVTLLVVGLVYWAVKHRQQIRLYFDIIH